MTHRHFQDDLDRLKSSLVGMAGLAERAVRDAVDALLRRDDVKANAVVAGDEMLDALEVEIENMAVNLLALQQPMARDLRLITMSLKISSDLERVGDHAVNIAENVQYIIKAPLFPVLPEIEEMVRVATEMLTDALDAFIRGDAAAARAVIARDDRVDELHENNFRILLTHMMEDARKIGNSLELLLVSRNLERVADLATNIAEDAVYVAEGKQIAHHFED